MFVLPAYSSMFSDFNFQLPLITMIAVKLPSFGMLFLFIFIVSSLLFVRKFKDFYFRVKLPIIGDIYKFSFLRDFCFSLNYQLKSGMQLVNALGNIKNNQTFVRFEIDSIISDIKQGKSLSYSLAKCKIFQGMLPQLVMVGEESGNMASMLSNAGEYFNSNAESRIKKLAALVEPMATLFVGGIVCFVAMAMLMPIFSMVNSLL